MLKSPDQFPAPESEAEKLAKKHQKDADLVNSNNREAIEAGTAVAVSAEDLAREDELLKQLYARADIRPDMISKLSFDIASGFPQRGLEGMERLLKGEKI